MVRELEQLYQAEEQPMPSYFLCLILQKSCTILTWSRMNIHMKVKPYVDIWFRKDARPLR
ncbi:hypothetical protein Scep_022077 [Stephania cephalantha]|uniref:Uncharacterized protein n=1 Tax=Stephania cephalantha TaxID=152367 RepID=A0AAP0FDG5_9MAGN